MKLTRVQLVGLTATVLLIGLFYMKEGSAAVVDNAPGALPIGYSITSTMTTTTTYVNYDPFSFFGGGGGGGGSTVTSTTCTDVSLLSGCSPSVFQVGSTTKTKTSSSTVTSTASTVTTTTVTTVSTAGDIPAGSYAVDVRNGQLVDYLGQRYTMVGLNYGDIPENFKTGNYETDAQRIKQAGFNTVKLTTQWGALETSATPSTFTYSSGEFSTLQQQITALTNQGINVVVKIHADSAGSGDGTNLHNFLGSKYCPTGSYNSNFQTVFYTTPASTAGSGMDHLSRLVMKISQLTRGNQRVIGIDPMNEPTYCGYVSSTDSQTIRTAWHQRIKELAQTLRADGDNRLIFAEEAPMFEYYKNFVSYNDPRIITSIHWYRAEYKTSGGTWAACWADMTTLEGYWGTAGKTGSSCSTVPLQIASAQQNNPGQLFEVGEFGNIYGNSPGGLDEQWILNSIQIFKNHGLVGWFYWSSSESGTWVNDLTSNKS